jgi:hypothetical protein
MIVRVETRVPERKAVSGKADLLSSAAFWYHAGGCFTLFYWYHTRGCFARIYAENGRKLMRRNALGFALGALVIELQKRGHRAEREVPIAVQYDGVVVGTYRVDILVDDVLVVEVKADRFSEDPRETASPGAAPS